jgi:hypothetical protein
MTHPMPNHDLTAVRKMGRGNQTKAVNLKTDNTKAKRKVQKENNDLQNITQKKMNSRIPHKTNKHG